MLTCNRLLVLKELIKILKMSQFWSSHMVKQAKGSFVTAVARAWALAQERPYATSAAKKKTKTETKVSVLIFYNK